MISAVITCNVIGWGKLAEAAAKLQVGTHVLVEGEVRSREYEKGGAIHRVSEIYAETIRRLAPNGRTEEPADNGQAPDEETPF